MNSNPPKRLDPEPKPSIFIACIDLRAVNLKVSIILLTPRDRATSHRTLGIPPNLWLGESLRCCMHGPTGRGQIVDDRRMGLGAHQQDGELEGRRLRMR
jgi:hypothetical protein